MMRGLLTNAVLTQLETAGKPIGDLKKPDGGGWPAGAGANSPGTTFVPYAVLVPMTATITYGPLADNQADAQIPYTIESYGVDRDQCEWMADTARGVLAAMKRTLLDLGDGTYKVQQAFRSSIGGVQRIDGADPPFYGQSDVVTIWLAKEA